MKDAMVWLRSIACFLVVCLAISGARAEEPWRVLDNTNEGSASDCIGNPKTPLCAVETAEACFKRGEFDLCRRVGYTWKELGRWVPTEYSLLHYYRYRVVGRGIIRQADIPPARKALEGLPVRAGDLALLMKWQGCPPIDQCVIETINHPTKFYGEGCRSFDNCGSADGFATYILRRHDEEWQVLLDFYHPVFQGEFWNRK
jgi:hypothetical protein